MRREVGGGSRRVGKEIWIVSVICGEEGWDPMVVIGGLTVFLTHSGIAQTTLDDDEEEDEE